MSVFTSRIHHKPWVWQITALGFVLGGLLAASLRTQDRIRQDQLPTTRIPGLASAYSEMRATVADQKKKIADLQTNLAKYQKAVAANTDSARLLSADLQKANVLSGLVAVTGPGVIVTLRDSKKPPPRAPRMTDFDYDEMVKQFIIHDVDVQVVLNELRAAGAEAIAINDQRVVGMTAVRCIGSTVQVNTVSTNANPMRIQAIGDSDTLASALTMAGGVQNQFPDATMFSIDKSKNLTLPAYAGATPLRFAKPAPDAKAEQAQKQSEDAAQPGP